MKAWYLESHKSFRKLSLKIHYKKKSEVLKFAHWVKAHYIVHKMLSQISFYNILKFVIGHVIKLNWLNW